MWVTIGGLIALIWIVFVVRARPLANAIDRGEVMILKPLGISYILLAIAMAVSTAWGVAVLCAVAWLLTGAVGASLHKTRTFQELSEGTAQHMQRGPRAPLSHGESHKLASVLLRATTILAVVVAVLLLHYSIRWYIALPGAFLAAWGFMFVAMVLVAYQRPPEAPSP